MLGLEVGMRTDEELLRPSGDDVGGSAAEKPSHSGAGTGEYPYQPLLSENQIRLLLLEPLAPGSTQDSQPICVTLHHVDFDSESLTTRPYRALSYEWGAPPEKDKDSPIIILDGHGTRIRKNLYNALKSIRYLKSEICDSNLWLWVDALCINQSDVQERGHQVRLMKRIYKTAEMVLVWLGIGDELSNAAMKAMNLEASEFENLVSREELTADEQRGIRNICCMGYWRRVWILQEFVLARNYLLICNQDFVSKEKFERAQAVWSDHSWKDGSKLATPFYRSFNSFIPQRGSEAKAIIQWRNERGTESSLFSLVNLCMLCNCGATDSRDYVYGLLGISDDCEGKIEPDYSRSVEEVYYSAVAVMMNKAGEARGLKGDSILDWCDRFFRHKLAIWMGVPLKFGFKQSSELVYGEGC